MNRGEIEREMCTFIDTYVTRSIRSKQQHTKPSAVLDWGRAVGVLREAAAAAAAATDNA